MSHTVIRNRFKRSKLPPLWDIAEALREGRTTLEQIADECGVQPRSITRRMYNAGWNPAGEPMRAWGVGTPDERPCTRCGYVRFIKKTTGDLCRDCRDVTRDLDGAA